MSKELFASSGSSSKKLSDQERLKRIATLDPNKFPLAIYAQAALDDLERDEVTQGESS